jgi:type I restriction enzyme S subunit
MMQLLEHFKELTLHPKNAQELKGLILQLAVQGKLTRKWREENHEVKPASVLLEKIENEKKQLIKVKKVKKEIFDPLSESDFYFDVPNKWEWERLGNIGFIFNGDSINSGIKEALYSNVEKGYPYIATKDVGYLFDQIDHENGIKIPFSESKFKIAEKGTVLICAEGGSAGKKMGIINQDCCFGNKLFAIKQFGGIESGFILSWYGSPIFSKVFRENMTGIIGGISRNSFANISIPIPPLEEQKAIVEVVNQLFAEVEQLETLTKERIQLKSDFVTSALNQLTQAAEQDTASQWVFLHQHFGTFFTEKENIKKLREGILQLAVQGKLTRDWRLLRQAQGTPTEPASTLLEKIKTEKEKLIKAGKIKKEKPLPEISEEEIPYELPEGWVWCRLGHLGDKITSAFVDGPFGSSINTKNDYIESGVPVLRMVNVKPYKFKNESMKYISEEKYRSFLRHGVIPGDILFSKVGAGIGEACIVPETLRYGMLSTTGISRIRVGEMVNNEYLCHFINSQSSYFKSLSQNSAQPFLNMTQIKTVLFPLPPKEEQKIILEKVNALMALCDQLEQEIENHQTTQEQWMQSCLREVV